jgi:hypothetical protein
VCQRCVTFVRILVTLTRIFRSQSAYQPLGSNSLSVWPRGQSSNLYWVKDGKHVRMIKQEHSNSVFKLQSLFFYCVTAVDSWVWLHFCEYRSLRQAPRFNYIQRKLILQIIRERFIKRSQFETFEWVCATRRPAGDFRRWRFRHCGTVYSVLSEDLIWSWKKVFKKSI